MQLIFGFILLLTTNLVQSTPFHGSRSCKEYTLPIKVTSANRIWTYPPFKNNFDVADWQTNMDRWDANVSYTPISNTTVTETEAYTISGTFCSPARGGNGVVILATHGGGYDRA